MSCPSCGGGIEFPTRGVGVEVPCPHCAQVVALVAPLPKPPPAPLPRPDLQETGGARSTGEREGDVVPRAGATSQAPGPCRKPDGQQFFAGRRSFRSLAISGGVLFVVIVIGVFGISQYRQREALQRRINQGLETRQRQEQAALAKRRAEWHLAAINAHYEFNTVDFQSAIADINHVARNVTELADSAKTYRLTNEILLEGIAASNGADTVPNLAGIIAATVNASGTSAADVGATLDLLAISGHMAVSDVLRNLRRRTLTLKLAERGRFAEDRMGSTRGPVLAAVLENFGEAESLTIEALFESGKEGRNPTMPKFDATWPGRISQNDIRSGAEWLLEQDRVRASPQMK